MHTYACMHVFMQDYVCVCVRTAGSVCVSQSFHERDSVRDEEEEMVAGEFLRLFAQIILISEP